MIISYSELVKWDTCPRQYYYSFVKGLQPLEMPEPMMLGINGHKLLQNFYTFMGEGYPKEEAQRLTTKSSEKLLQNNKYDLPLLKAWTLVDNYIRATEFKSEAIIVENRYLFPLSQLSDHPLVQDVQIGFTPDVVFQRQGGFCDVEDAKFVGRAWAESKLKHFVQAKIYQILLKRMGYNVSRSTVRFFNTQTAQIKSHNAELKFGEEATIIQDLISAVVEVVHYKNDAFRLANTRRTTNNNMCQGCAFDFPCTLEGQGKDASRTFDSLFRKKDYDYNV